MPDTSYGPPSFATGNPAWNSALGTLAQGLFPNPAAGAQAYHYGSEARKAQIEGYKSIGENNAATQALTMSPGAGLQSSPITFQQPPITGMGPIIAPPQGLPMQAPPGTPPPSAPPPAPTQPPAAAPPLSGAVVPPATGAAVAPPGGGVAPPPPPGPVSLDRLSSIVAPGDQPNDKGVGTTGTPSAASPPSAVAPPAPNTTTSNGQVPTNDQGSGQLHPGWVTDADGGQKYSAPAQANGSPTPPKFDLTTYANLQAMAGRNPEMAKLQILSYILGAEQRGNLPVGTAKTVQEQQSQNDQLSAAFGSPVFESKQATARTGITAAAGIQEENIRQAGDTARTRMGVQTGVGPDGKPVFTNAGAIADAPGTIPAFNNEVYTTGEAVHTTGGGGPYGTGGQLVKAKDLTSGTPAPNQAVDTAMNSIVQVYQLTPDGKPDASQAPVPMRYGDALRQQRPLTPASTDQVNAILRGAALTGDATQPAGRLSQVVAATTPPPTPEPANATEADKMLQLEQRHFADVYKPASTTIGRQELAAPTSEAQTVLDDRISELRRADPRMPLQTAVLRARSEMETAGELPTVQQQQGARAYTAADQLAWGNRNIDYQVSKGQVAGRFMVPLLKDYTNPRTGMTVKATGAGVQKDTLGAVIAPAPPGSKEGDTGTYNGKRVKVVNGKLLEIQ